MNLVLDEAEEVSIKKNTRKPLGEDSLFDNKSLIWFVCFWFSNSNVNAYLQEGFYSKETT